MLENTTGHSWFWTFIKFPIKFVTSIATRCVFNGYRVLSVKVLDVIELVEFQQLTMSRKHSERPMKRRRVQTVIFGSFLKKAIEYQRQTDVEELIANSSNIESKVKANTPRKKSTIFKTKRQSEVFTVCGEIRPDIPVLGSCLLGEDILDNNTWPRMRSRMGKSTAETEESSPLLPDPYQKMEMFLKEREKDIDSDLQKLKQCWKRNSHKQEETNSVTNIVKNNAKDESFVHIEIKNSETDTNSKHQELENKHDAVKASSKQNSDTKQIIIDDKAVDDTKLIQIDQTNLQTGDEVITLKVQPICLPTRDKDANKSCHVVRRVGVIKPMNKKTGEEISSISATIQRQTQQDVLNFATLSTNEKNDDDSDDEVTSFSLCCCMIL